MERRPLNLAFFGWIDRGSGAEQLTRKTVEGLNARGHNARFYVRVATKPGGFVYQIPYLRREIGLETLLRRFAGWNDFFFPSTWLLAKEPWLRDADLWHFHNLHGHFMSIPGLSWQSRKRKIVLSPVDQFLTTGYCPYSLNCERFSTGCGNCPQLDLPYPGISRDTTRWLWKMKRKAIGSGKFYFVFHTEFLFRHHQSTLGLKERIQHLRYGVDVNANRPLPRAECAEKLGLQMSEKLVVGLFHSDVLENRKGLLPLLHGLQQISRNLPGKIEVLVVGRNSDRALSLSTPELSVSSLPFCETEEELAQALNLCDVLLYPTRAENMSLTCLCALACGVPVISSRIGGQSEAIVDGHNGFLTEAGDDKAILLAVEALAKEPDTKARMSENARRTAVERFDMAAYVDRLIEYYYAEVLTAA
jgi:glycosyltransferase involved in cell wall biosynthesis